MRWSTKGQGGFPHCRFALKSTTIDMLLTNNICGVGAGVGVGAGAGAAAATGLDNDKNLEMIHCSQSLSSPVPK
jgi:hypothetical protein